jgi:hypothetical protein
MQKPVTRFGNPCDIYLEAQERSQRKQRKEERKKYECYRDQKGNRGNVGNHCRIKKSAPGYSIRGCRAIPAILSPT